jgi:hypothetical protein
MVEYMPLAGLIQYGTPALLFALVILQVVEIVTIRNMSARMNGFAEKKICELQHKSIDKTIEVLEADLKSLMNRGY